MYTSSGTLANIEEATSKNWYCQVVLTMPRCSSWMSQLRVDVANKEIYHIIDQLQKMCILFISSELPEILGMCDRTWLCARKGGGRIQPR
jgi:hypothetical protein